MDILGIKDKVRCSGLCKNFRKPEIEWTPQEIEIDSRLQVKLCFNADHTSQYYSATIPWKT